MKPLIRCLSAIVLLAASALAHADAKSDAAARAKAIAPFIEAETAVVVRFDLTRVDTSAAFDIFARFQPIPQGELAEKKQRVAKQLHEAIRAGIKEFYVIATPGGQSDVGWMPKVFSVVPLPPDADVTAIRAIAARSGRGGPSGRRRVGIRF